MLDIQLSALRKKDSPVMSNNDDVDAFKLGLELKLKIVSMMFSHSRQREEKIKP